MLNELGLMQARLVGLVARMRDAAGHVAMAGAEIASGNNDLATRTERSASNLEELAASVEELVSTVRQTAGDTARSGRDVVERLAVTTTGIAAASNRISEITGVVAGIAFQAHILALNALVEAARAGAQGLGFAMMAAEVRNRAQRSAVAAREIGGLIADSARQVGDGARLPRAAGTTMAEIVEPVSRVTAIIGEITAAAGEQSLGLGQGGDAVSRLDRTTRRNAALVEESSAAAEALRDQAQALSSLVGTFRLPA